MRQPIQSRAQATIDGICTAALSILTESGWDAFNTNAVAARAGVSGPTVYRYFPDKYVLAAELRRRLDEAEAQVALPAVERIGGVADLPEAVGAWVKAVAKERARQPAAVLLRSIPRSIPDLRPGDAEAADVVLAALASSLRRRQPALTQPQAVEYAGAIRTSVDSLIDEAVQPRGIDSSQVLLARDVATTLIAAATRSVRAASPSR